MAGQHSLFRRSKDQPADTAYAVFYAEHTTSGDDYDAPFKAIASRTWEGYASWQFHQNRFISKYKSDVQKLKNYLDYTYVRLLDLEQSEPGKYFRYSSDGERVCFNTGLQNPHQSDLLATFQKAKPGNNGKAGSPWVYRGCYAPNDDGYKKFFPQEIPEIAWYSRNSQDFIFDPTYALEDHTFDHLFDRAKERAGLPNATDEGVRNYLSGTIKNLLPKIKRNYKVAIPVYYVKEKRMQMLLPFPSAGNKDEVAAFLVDRDDAGQIYRLKTIFDLDQAYFSARLITRPDQEWLNP